jgi:hypothetical protein
MGEKKAQQGQGSTARRHDEHAAPLQETGRNQDYEYVKNCDSELERTLRIENENAER